jgi:hypothetical protein
MTDIIEKVTKKGAAFPYDIRLPLIPPITAMINNTMMTASTGKTSVFNNPAIRQELKATIEPTERSIPPVRITNSCPTANIVMTAFCLRIFIIFVRLKKYGVKIELIMIITRNIRYR